jgi:hypothetical protein
MRIETVITCAGTPRSGVPEGEDMTASAGAAAATHGGPAAGHGEAAGAPFVFRDGRIWVQTVRYTLQRKG